MYHFFRLLESNSNHQQRKNAVRATAAAFLFTARRKRQNVNKRAGFLRYAALEKDVSQGKTQLVGLESSRAHWRRTWIYKEQVVWEGTLEGV